MSNKLDLISSMGKKKKGSSSVDSFEKIKNHKNIFEYISELKKYKK